MLTKAVVVLLVANALYVQSVPVENPFAGVYQGNQQVYSSGYSSFHLPSIWNWSTTPKQDNQPSTPETIVSSTPDDTEISPTTQYYPENSSSVGNWPTTQQDTEPSSPDYGTVVSSTEVVQHTWKEPSEDSPSSDDWPVKQPGESINNGYFPNQWAN